MFKQRNSLLRCSNVTYLAKEFDVVVFVNYLENKHNLFDCQVSGLDLSFDSNLYLINLLENVDIRD